jgi:lipid-binding SYLF domain-containing protein
VVKAGLLIGGQYGQGALRKKCKTVGYYKTMAASYGLQAGAQSFGYALFFLSESAPEYLTTSKGWEIGVGPTITVVDEGLAKSMTTKPRQRMTSMLFLWSEGPDGQDRHPRLRDHPDYAGPVKGIGMDL